MQEVLTATKILASFPGRPTILTLTWW